MKVLMISPGLPNENTSGLGFAVEQIANSLSSRLSLTIIQPEDVNNQSQIKELDTNQFKEEAVVNELTHINVKGNLSPYSYTNHEYKQEEEGGVKSEFEFFTQSVSNIAQTLDFDLIYAHDWVTFQAAKKLKERTKKPLVLHVHSLDVDRISSTSHSWVFNIEKTAFEIADAIISVSNYSANRIHKFYAIPTQKIHTVYNGCSLTLFPNYKKIFDEPVVLFAGRLTNQKAPQVFIEIAEKILQKRKDIRFVMAGEGPMKNSLIEMAAHKGIGDHVHFTGFVDRNEVAKI
ncbi:MAG: glycosyltransferase family 4 protein, partial [Bacteroidota bacterium]